MIDWKQNPDNPGYHAGRVGKWRSFSVARPLAFRDPGKPWTLFCTLPGLKASQGNFATVEEAQERAERVWDHWATGIPQLVNEASDAQAWRNLMALVGDGVPAIELTRIDGDMCVVGIAAQAPSKDHAYMDNNFASAVAVALKAERPEAS